MKHYKYISGYSDYSLNDFTDIIGAFSDNYVLNNAPFTLHSDYTINQNEKLYFLPGTSVPRIKLKDIFAQTKSKTTRNIAEATKVIGSVKSLDKLLDATWYYWVTVPKFLEFLEIALNKGDVHPDDYKDTIDHVINDEIILTDYAFIRNLKCNESITLTPEIDYIQGSRKFLHLEDKYFDIWDELKDCTVYDEATLISLVNGDDSTSIDEKMFESLSQMLSSSDEDNHVLALEIMANSNYSDSLYYLCLLFEQFHYIISNTRTRNHVNFKSLVYYMGFASPNYVSMTKDSIVELLVERDVFTPKMAMDLLQKYNEDIINYGSSEKFAVTKVSYSKDVLEYLNNKKVNESVVDTE